MYFRGFEDSVLPLITSQKRPLSASYHLVVLDMQRRRLTIKSYAKAEQDWRMPTMRPRRNGHVR